MLVRMGSLAGEAAAQAERDRQLDRLSTVIDASPVAIVEVDPESGRVRLWNRAAERIYGWRAAEVLGQPHPAITEQGWQRFHTTVARIANEPLVGLELRQHPRSRCRRTPRRQEPALGYLKAGLPRSPVARLDSG
jgi:PAS domain-containing protein